jgi:hypothetical protein
MTIGKVLFAIMLVATATSASAQDNMGTPQEQSACRPDTRKYCIHVKADAGPFAFLSCLQQNRQKLSKACRQVLESHGQ